jgi:pyruvate ferredoxin oxidoreductase gamma subunit
MAMWLGWKAKDDRPAPRPATDIVSLRMEAIGGQGANSAGKILAEAAALGMNYTASHFSSYGSEKRGSPVRSYVRFSAEKKMIRTVAAIREPNVLAIFHENLIKTHPEILEGVTSATHLILNSTTPAHRVHLPDGYTPHLIATVDASKIALKFGSGINAAMLGAISIYVSEISMTVLEETLDRFFKNLPDKVRLANHSAFREARNKVQHRAFTPKDTVEKPKLSPLEHLSPLGFNNAPIGGAIVNPGNTVLKDNSASRKGLAPKFIKELCFNCGFCDMVCPDFCFVWKKTPQAKLPAELQGIDYQYCKACAKCVEVCPVNALIQLPEDEIPIDEQCLKIFAEQKQGDE